MAKEEDTEGPNCPFGAGQNGPTFLHFSNILGPFNPTSSIPSMTLPVIRSCKKRHEALIREVQGKESGLAGVPVCPTELGEAGNALYPHCLAVSPQPH